ncbi:MAG: hypothetical protein AAF618_07720 [Pseudomonadota bacterium]
MPPADAVVICQGHHVTTIWINADGEEVEQAALCAEAALSLLVQAGIAAPALPAPETVLPFSGATGTHQYSQSSPTSSEFARGPPPPV